MSAYAMAHVHSTNFGPELIEYLRRIDATMEPFGGRFLFHGGLWLGQSNCGVPNRCRRQVRDRSASLRGHRF